jgi:hypothetical protein
LTILLPLPVLYFFTKDFIFGGFTLLIAVLIFGIGFLVGFIMAITS